MATQDEASNVQLLFVQNILVLRGFVTALLPDFSQVDDVIQETFLTVTAKANDFEPGTNFQAWACTIARYKVLELTRRTNTNVVLLDAEVIEALCSTPLNNWNPESEMLAIEKCKETLAPQARRAIELRYEKAKQPPEIAKQMGWKVNAVNVALSRARRVLRDCVKRHLPDSNMNFQGGK